MRPSHFLGVVALAAIVPNLAAADYACPVTKPPSPAFVPPAPYQANAGLEAFWYGDKDLWALLPANGTWHGLPLRENVGYFNKLFLWQQGYDGTKEPKPDITVVVRRLDADAPVHTSRSGTNAFFGYTWQMLTGVSFPTYGCWEVTSSHSGHTLTFVLSIQP